MSAKLFQFLDVPRQPPRTVPVAVRVLGYGEIGGDFASPQAATQAERCIDCGNPYCEHECPVHNYIPNWLKLVQEGRLMEAATLHAVMAITAWMRSRSNSISKAPPVRAWVHGTPVACTLN